MRKFNRGSTPNCLTKKNAKGISRKNKCTEFWKKKVQRFRKKGIGQLSFSWYKLDRCLKPKLLLISKRHCAFCDKKFSRDEAKNGSEIEHFYPKIKFPHKAFSWTNLFPICRACNKEKGATFNTLLRKPDTPKYTFEQYFIFNFKTGEIEPNPKSSIIVQARANETIDIYKLNRIGLPDDRLEALDFYENSENNDIDFYSHRNFIELGFLT